MFKYGSFKLHSGGYSSFKIDCDTLTAEDWATLARIVSNSYAFCDVFGVPTGGENFAEALREYIDKDSHCVLIVDDVLTTGNSMNKMYNIVKKKIP